MADLRESWSTQQLVEFLAAVSSYPNERSAIIGAVERAAEALEAEVGAVVRDGRLIASTGFPAGAVATAPIIEAAQGEATTLDVPGAGSCAVISVPLEDRLGGRLLLARASQPFDRQEAALLRGMARVLTLALQALRVISDERALRAQSEQQSRENARLLGKLRERQELFERLSKIQRSIVRRAELGEVLEAIVAGASDLLKLEAVALRLRDPVDEQQTILVASRGLAAARFPVGSRTSLGEGVSGRAIVEERLVIVNQERDDSVTHAALERRNLRSAMAAPVVENGRVIGALTVGSRDPAHPYNQTEQELLVALAEHASLALTDARNYDAALHRAYHDLLTGLPNRALFLERLEQVAAKPPRGDSRPVVLFMDLDGFKRVNDSLGHAAGDELLVEVARRLRGCVRPVDTAARFGGDEFAVLLEGISDEREAERIAERVMAAVEAPYWIGERELIITASIGVAPLRRAGDDLIRDADLAMYDAKSNGTGRWKLFDPSMRTALVARIRLESDLGRAVELQQFELAYQPIVELQSGAVAAVEALVRWRHPERGVLLPGAFIPAAEDTGMIREIGRQVLNQACRQAAAWQQRHRGSSPLAISVNLSVTQLQQAGLLDEVASALDSSGLAPGSLILEITETVLLHDVERDALTCLKQLGIQIAVDDFGTGYSSLQYLQHFPVDILKIDKSFVSGIADPSQPALAKAIIDVGESLKLRVVAEGLEDPEQITRLTALGCRWGQGYHYARPQTAERLDQLLKDSAIAGWPADAVEVQRTKPRRATRASARV